LGTIEAGAAGFVLKDSSAVSPGSAPTPIDQ
jgi:hypothetical protein